MVITTDGKLVSKLEVPSPTAPNVAFGPDGKTLYAVDDTETPLPGDRCELRSSLRWPVDLAGQG